MKKKRSKNNITFKTLFNKAVALNLYKKSYSSYIREYKKNKEEVNRLKRQIYKEEIKALNKIGIKNKTELKKMAYGEVVKKIPKNLIGAPKYESINAYLKDNTPTKSYLKENYTYDKLKFNKRILNNVYDKAATEKSKGHNYKPKSFHLIDLNKLDAQFVKNVITSLIKAGHTKQAQQIKQARKKYGNAWIVNGIKQYGGVVIDLFINNVNYRYDIESEGFYVYLNEIIESEKARKTTKGAHSKNKK